MVKEHNSFFIFDYISIHQKTTQAGFDVFFNSYLCNINFKPTNIVNQMVLFQIKVQI